MLAIAHPAQAASTSPRRRRSARGLALASIAGALLLPSAAAAQGAERSADPAQQRDPVAPAPSEPLRWYGYQTLAVDGAAFALAGAGLALGFPSENKGASTALLIGGATVYAFGAFTIHLLHGQIANARLGGTVRAVLPLVGFVVPLMLFGIGDRQGDSGAGARVTATEALLATGFLVPVGVDAVIATEPGARAGARASSGRAIVLQPGYSSGPSLGVAGAF